MTGNQAPLHGYLMHINKNLLSETGCWNDFCLKQSRTKTQRLTRILRANEEAASRGGNETCVLEEVKRSWEELSLQTPGKMDQGTQWKVVAARSMRIKL
ncbi:cysteine-rich PDZ-binding protein isoform X2 [Mobula hypostoma]|uniref:cysteine-rich PDZ-binding protein isoform X2 n=1 Tax=Mobula hypostoma TaxID=723540 RepID=UPI002FC33CB0